MEILYTGFAITCLLACAACVYACYRHVDEAHEAANDVRASRGKIVANAESIEVLEHKLTKLRGTVYHIKAKVDAQREEEAEQEETYGNDPLATHNLAPRAPFCENYGRA